MSLAAEAQPFREFIDVTFASLQEERGALDGEVRAVPAMCATHPTSAQLSSAQGCPIPLQREQVRALVSRCMTALRDVPSKLHSCLQERDAALQRVEEALQAKKEVMGPPGAPRGSQIWRGIRGGLSYGGRGEWSMDGCSLGCGMLWVNPTSLQVSQQLEETLEALQDAVAQGEQLAVTNSRLSTGSGGGEEGTAGGWQRAAGCPRAHGSSPHRSEHGDEAAGQPAAGAGRAAAGLRGAEGEDELVGLHPRRLALPHPVPSRHPQPHPLAYPHPSLGVRLTKERDALQRERRELQEAVECREVRARARGTWRGVTCPHWQVAASQQPTALTART